MIIDRQGVQYSGNTVVQKRGFTVSDTVLISDLLSNMYTNPVLACVREYICNAIDSHVAADKPISEIVVTCPTILHSYFEVQDYGVGMSEDEVYALMTSYGSSNKRQSNSLVGGFGIGSKAAFAYTDNFTFISVKNNIKNTFLCYVDGDHGPQIERLSSVPTDEPNGVLVKIRVKGVDLTKFTTETQNIVKWLDVQPRVVGCNITPVVYTRVGSGYKFFVEDGYTRKIYIRMGGVVYSTTNTSYNFKASVVLDYPIGCFKLAPSRESIINSTEAQAEITRRVDLIKVELNAVFVNEIRKQPTLFQARNFYYAFNDSVISVPHNVYWRGHYVTDNINWDSCFVPNNSYKVKSRSFKRKSHYVQRYSFAIVLTSKPSTDIVRNYNAVLVDYETNSGTNPSVYCILHGTPKQQLRQWLKLGRPEVPIINLDTYVITKITPVFAAQRKSVEFKVLSVNKSYLQSTHIDVNDGQPRKFIRSYDGQLEHWALRNIKLTSPFTDFKEFFGIKDEVVVVPKTLSDKVPDNWVDLSDHIERFIRDFVELSYEHRTKTMVRQAIFPSNVNYLSQIKSPIGRFYRRAMKINTRFEELKVPHFLSFIYHQCIVDIPRSSRVNNVSLKLQEKYKSINELRDTRLEDYICLINKSIEYDRLVKSNRYISNKQCVCEIQPQSKETTNV